MWTGRQALENGLIDGLGGLEAAVATARERTGVDAGDPVRLVVLPEKKGLWETILERREEELAVRLLGPEAGALVGWVERLGGNGPLARLPFELEIR